MNLMRYELKMNLTRYELKKTLKSPVTAIAIVAVLLLNLYTLFLGSQDASYCSSGAYRPPYQTDIELLKQNGAYFAGEITDEWFQKYKAEVEAIIDNPANHVSDEEKEQIRQELKYVNGYTDEKIADCGNFIYLKEAVLHSNEYQKYEGMEFAARFYERAANTGVRIAEEYRERYPRTKGEALAAKTEEMYSYMAQDYTAYYNYRYGYEKLRIMHTVYPFTIGLIILIALSPIFAAEYSG